MPTADRKKAGTIRNLWHQLVAEKVLAANDVVDKIRAAITDNSLTGEFTLAERNAMLAVETDLNNLAASVGITSAENKYVPTHRNRAINVEGVNDG